MRINKQDKLYFAIILLLISLLLSEVQANIEKLSNKEKIFAEFEGGQQKVKVIVGLEMPQHLKNIKSYKDKQFKAQVRAQIAERQSNVLSGLSANEFVLSHRYKNFECFAGEVSEQGLAMLIKHRLVKSVELSRIEHPMLAQGIGLIKGLTIRSSYNGQNVAIAISDTGVDYTHPRLGGGGFPNIKVIGGYDTGDNDSNPIPNDEAHGTACAGIAAGDLGTVGDYIGGVAHNAKIYAMKISSGSGGSAYDTDVIQAWDWCIDHQYDDVDNPILVVSHSFGGGRYFSSAEAESDSPFYALAAGRLVAAGITVFAASGNEGYCESMAAPAAFSDVISVGSVYDTGLGSIGFCVEPESCIAVAEGQCSPPWACWDSSGADVVSCYSNSATFLDLLAPAHDAYTTDISGLDGYEPGDYTPDFGGTSAACPYAAGAAACLQSAAKILTGDYLTVQELRDTLVNTGDYILDSKSSIATPRVNLQSAIDSIQTVEIPPSAFNVSVSTNPNTPIIITLDASDDGFPNPPAALAYIITSLPNYGQISDPCAGSILNEYLPYTLVGYGNNVTYTAAGCYTGLDGFGFKVNDSGTAPFGGDSNTAAVSIDVQLPTTIIYETDFEAGLPTGWSIIDGGSSTHTWTISNPCGRTSSYWTGNFMIVDSDCAGNKTMDEQLITNSIDCSGLKNVRLAFSHYFRWWYRRNDEIGDVDIRINGGPWQNIARYQGQDFEGIVELDISSLADEQNDVQIRWHYYNAKDEWYWGIDDVKIIASETLVPLAGDFEFDCFIDFTDFSLLANVWMTEPNNSNWNVLYDISEPNDNIIDAIDLDALANNWLVQWP